MSDGEVSDVVQRAAAAEGGGGGGGGGGSGELNAGPAPAAVSPPDSEPKEVTTETAQPGTAQPETAQPETAQPETAQPETQQREVEAEAESAEQPETEQPEAEQPEEGESDQPEKGEYEEGEYDEEEVYKLKRHRRAPDAAAAATSARPAERKRPPRAAGDDDAERSRAPARKRSSGRGNSGRGSSGGSGSASGADAEDEPVDEATRERRALEAKIDAALQPSSKRRKKLAGDDLEMLQDEAIAQLRDSMRHAALADVEAIREGRPAVEKVRMLPEVVRLLQKGALADSILDGNLLESVRIWLEPLQDASLPSFEIQRVLFEALVKLPIKTIHLRESGLGRVVLFYQKSRRPQPVIKRMAQKLIGDWTRPIIGRSDNYRDKRVVTADFDPREAVRAARGAAPGPRSSYEEAAARQNRAAIPSASGVSYQVAPVSSGAAAAGAAGSAAAPAAASRDSQLRRMKTKLMAGRAGRKKSQVSVEGKDLN